MNAKNLPLKFVAVAVLAALCLWSLFTKGTQQGIDLRGGHSLIFAINTPEREIQKRQAELAESQKKLADPAATEDEKKLLQGRIAQIKEDIERLEADEGGGGNLSERMISILKERIDPRGLANLEWRPVGSNRIEVRMPAGREDTQDKRRAYKEKIDALRAGNVSRTQKRRYQYASPADREAMLELERFTQRQKEHLEAIGQATDQRTKAEAALKAARAGSDAAKIQAAQDAFDIARASLREKELALLDTSVRTGRLETILANYRTPREQAELNEKEAAELSKQLARDLDALRAEHPDRVGQINAVAEAYKAWAQVRHRLSDPSDLQRRIAKAGVLEFRIVAGHFGQQIDRKDQEYYAELLRKEGPEEIRRRGADYAWFPLRNNDRTDFAGMVIEEYAGRWHVLLCNQKENRMVRQRGDMSWRLKEAYSDNDQYGRPAIGFTFDEIGARQFYDLTALNKDKRMAILLDDEVFSAPSIQTAISSRGQITGKFTSDAVSDYVRLLEAGSLPARLNPNPVAARSFHATLGKENRERGVRAAWLGLICVAAFMLIYYLMAGGIADVALLLNIILVLGAMSLLDAVFTLPGIAGVILTIGIAVDANVLIFERLREEQAKGQSVRMAIKNAYERAFSAIFDANITTLITCMILGWVGTIEVRGFAITLGLGVAFSMFTALMVTRWVFQMLLGTRWLQKPVFMLSIIGVPKINWMGKRKLFWVVSGLLVVLGGASLISQGGDILGIEFSSGTQATVRFRPDALIGADAQPPNGERVRQLFVAQAAKDGNTALQAARVEMLYDADRARKFLEAYDADGDGKVTLAEAKAGRLNEKFFALMDTGGDQVLDGDELDGLPESSYQISTTVTELVPIQNAVREAFGRSLARRTKCAFELASGAAVESLGLTCDGEGKARIEPVAGSPYLETLEEYAGGVAIVVRNVSPPITTVDLTQRIAEMRYQQGATGQSEMRQTEVIALGKPAEEGHTSFAVLVKVEEATSARWAVAAEGELELVNDALQREEAITVLNFDKAIAGVATQRAIIAMVLSWVAIVLYLWLRFGSIQWAWPR